MAHGTSGTDLVSFFRRRFTVILIPFASSLALAILVTAILPSTYESEATILIESRDSSTPLIHSTASGFIEERLRTIRQVVLSQKNLVNLISTHSLYPGLTGTYGSQRLVAKMRQDIKIEPIQAEVVDPRTGRSAPLTVAFTVGFQYRDPKKAAEITKTLVSYFLSENARTRETKARTTFKFLEGRLDELQMDILQAEEDIARFKEQHLHSLPELLDMNLMALQRIQRDMESKQILLNAALDRTVFLEGQLAILEPHRNLSQGPGGRTMTAEEELESLRSHLVTLKAAHSPRHPDVIRTARQVAALEKIARTKGRLRPLYQRLEARENSRRLALQKFSSRHPDVKAMDREIENLRKRIRDAAGDSAQDDRPDNPAWISTRTQLESARMEVESIKDMLKELRSTSITYERRIEQTPRTEQEFTSLERTYASLQTEHRDTYNRFQAAREAVDLEQQQMGERFIVAEPPTVPESPTKPNRPVLFVLGLIISMGIGGGVGMIAENLDQTFHGTSDLLEETSLPVLGSVPYLESPREIGRRRMRLLASSMFLAASAATGLTIIHVVYKPLDELWLKATKLMGLLF